MKDKRTWYTKKWFDEVVGVAVNQLNAVRHTTFKLLWYGRPDAPYYEMPHVEVLNWRRKGFKLVESVKPYVPPKKKENISSV